MRRLEGRSAVITGGGQGIGLGIARRLAAEGACLVLVDLDEARLAAAVKDIGPSAPTLTICADITMPNAPQKMRDATVARFGKVDILVNNAGIAPRGAVGQTSDHDWNSVIEVNLSAMFRLTRTMIDELKKSAHGRIINISSMNGLIGFRESSGYAVAKAGVLALTRSLAADYSKFGITANAIAPGVIDTELARKAIAARPAWFKRVSMDATPAERMGQVADIAGAAAFFASDDASYISGQVLAIDGGLTATRYQPDE